MNVIPAINFQIRLSFYIKSFWPYAQFNRLLIRTYKSYSKDIKMFIFIKKKYQNCNQIKSWTYPFKFPSSNNWESGDEGIGYVKCLKIYVIVYLINCLLRNENVNKLATIHWNTMTSTLYLLATRVSVTRVQWCGYGQLLEVYTWLLYWLYKALLGLYDGDT